jgi:hypothetical protein
MGDNLADQLYKTSVGTTEKPVTPSAKKGKPQKREFRDYGSHKPSKGKDERLDQGKGKEPSRAFDDMQRKEQYKEAAEANKGKYKDYEPVTEGKAWMFEDGAKSLDVSHWKTRKARDFGTDEMLSAHLELIHAMPEHLKGAARQVFASWPAPQNEGTVATPSKTKSEVKGEWANPYGLPDPRAGNLIRSKSDPTSGVDRRGDHSRTETKAKKPTKPEVAKPTGEVVRGGVEEYFGSGFRPPHIEGRPVTTPAVVQDKGSEGAGVGAPVPQGNKYL